MSSENPLISVFTGDASTSFVIISAALVMIMTPAVGLLYSGLSRSKNALIVIMLSFMAYAIVAIQWIIFGFSLAFSETKSSFIGDLSHAGFKSVGWNVSSISPSIPIIGLAIFQMQFACVTASLIFGSVIERIRILPSLIFIFVWTTLIYDPIAYW